MALKNKNPSKEEIGKYLGDILMYVNLKDKFVGIKDELAELGFGRIEVLDDAFKFVKKDDKPGNLIYVPGKLEDFRREVVDLHDEKEASKHEDPRENLENVQLGEKEKESNHEANNQNLTHVEVQ